VSVKSPPTEALCSVTMSTKTVTTSGSMVTWTKSVSGPLLELSTNWPDTDKEFHPPPPPTSLLTTDSMTALGCSFKTLLQEDLTEDFPELPLPPLPQCGESPELRSTSMFKFLPALSPPSSSLVFLPIQEVPWASTMLLKAYPMAKELLGSEDC